MTKIPYSRFNEIRGILWNYTGIIEAAKALNLPSDDCIYQALLRRVSMVVPILEEELQAAKEAPPKHVPLVRLQLEEIKNSCKTVHPQQETHSSSFHEGESPFVLLLRLAEKAKKISFDMQDKGDWDPFTSVREYISAFQFKPNRSKGRSYLPGLPSCILTGIQLSPGHNVTITSSQDKCYEIRALCNLFHKQHKEYKDGIMNKAKDQASSREEGAAVAKRIKDLDQVSSDLREWLLEKGEKGKKLPKKTKQDIDSWLRNRDFTPTILPLTLATWDPTGEYKPACLLDHIRFRAHRPPQAKKTEKKLRVKQRHIYGAKSCAEWAAFLEWVAHIPI
ncbi:hypothetical protein F5Y10DRAFT_293259 [Nemania abortiva]|nr:hypothetical protein F5Y10DRAFT_293259 [Nemania abortiva]